MTSLSELPYTLFFYFTYTILLCQQTETVTLRQGNAKLVPTELYFPQGWHSYSCLPGVESKPWLLKSNPANISKCRRRHYMRLRMSSQSSGRGDSRRIRIVVFAHLGIQIITLPYCTSINVIQKGSKAFMQSNYYSTILHIHQYRLKRVKGVLAVLPS